MKKIKLFTLLLIMPSMVLGACSNHNSSSEAKPSSLESSSEPSSSVEPSSSTITSEKSSSAIPSESSSLESSSPSKKDSSSSSSSSSESSSSSASSSSSSTEEKPQETLVSIDLEAGINKQKGSYHLETLYSDNFFDSSAKEYDEDLSILSFFSSCASVTKISGESFFRNATFSDVTSYSYESAPTKDSIAYMFAHKEFKGADIVAISVRGFDYGQEWANNFLIGEEGDHEGFASSANKVYASLKEYIADQCDNNKTLKLWISGYSRGGAVSNVLSSLIIENEEITINRDNMYVYTFEAPAALEREKCLQYENVHTIVNKNDLVANVPPVTYYLGKCGVNYQIYDENVASIAKEFDEELIIPEIVPIDTGESLDTDEKILQYVLDGIFNNTINPSDEDNNWSANTRKEYVDNYQSSISYLVGTIFLFKGSTRTQLLNDLSALGLGAMSTLMDAQAFHDFIKKYLGMDNITYDDEELMKACQDVPKAAEHLFIKVLLIYGSETYRQDLMRLIDMHFPEVTYALLLNAHAKI